MTYEEMKATIEEVEELKKQRHELKMMLDIQDEFKTPLVISNQGYDYRHNPLSKITQERLTGAVKDEIENIDAMIDKLTIDAGLDF